ncbi:hypothetical protein MmmBen_0334 [Mycoplasma mycoides subsp. mycoides]|nr:hypothetical protein MmmBen_0334 [Mycoplasma mycoides subsp. mycoides]
MILTTILSSQIKGLNAINKLIIEIKIIDENQRLFFIGE